MIYGYARCSNNEAKQDIDRQVKELKNAGAQNVFLEYEHGDTAIKQQLSLLLETAKRAIRSLHLKCLVLPEAQNTYIKS